MNRNGFAAALVLLGTLGAAPANAQGTAAPIRPQGTAAPVRPQPSTPQPLGIAVPVSKVAVIFSEEFQNAKTGITRFIVLATKLNGEFQSVQTDLSATGQRLKQLQAEITNLQRGAATVTPAQIQAKIDQLDQQKKDYQRKGEDAQASYQRRRNELLGPLQDDVGKALDAYAKAHGITMIIDGSQVPLLYASDRIDITKAFISDYNSKNPASATTTVPR